MTKFKMLAIPAIAAAALFSISANAASVTSTATVTIKKPLTISEGAVVNFGTVIPTVFTTAAVVTLPTGGTATSGDAAITGSSAGSYNIAGEDGATYAITGLAATDLTGAGGADMPITFTSSPSSTGTLSGSGTETLLVGAVLNVGASQGSGTYTGTYAVTVNYN